MIATRHPEPHDYQVADPPPFTPLVRTWRPEDEFGWVIHSWCMGHRDAPPQRKRLAADYKARYLPVLREALLRADMQVLVAEGPVPGRGVGWLAWARWPSIDTLHWVYVGKPFRHRGVMAALLAAAALTRHVTYTHEGAVRRAGEPRSDEWIAEQLRGRGAIVSFTPYQDWSR